MASENLERLVERRLLSRHRATRQEIENHVKVAREFAAAASLRGVGENVRFNNLYDAAHAAALAGLKLAEALQVSVDEALRELEIRLKQFKG